jgi:hypothetical protein
MKTRSCSRSKSQGSNKSEVSKKRTKKVLKSRGASRSKSRGKDLNKEKIKCGLCGKSKKLMQIECCNNWICDDYDKYVQFSYGTISCHRNHNRYTLCSHHFHEAHKGHWQNCEECKTNMNTEMYVWFGTNEFNFEKLKVIPSYEPTKCYKCQRIIKLGTEPHAVLKDQYTCFHCLALEEKFF